RFRPPSPRTIPRTKLPSAPSPIPKCGVSAKCWAARFAASAILRSRHVKIPGNMQQMMRQAQQMQEKLQAEIAQMRVEATAGGGIITVKMDGQKNLISVKLDPEAAGDGEMRQDLTVAACKEGGEAEE